MGRVAEAAPLYERARAFEPRNFVTLWRMGSFRARIGHMDEALALYDKALHKAPEAARCQIRLEKAECLLSLGRIEDARALMLRDLATTPHRARYLCLLSGSGRDDAGSALYGDICAEIERPGLAPQDRCDLMIRKGVMLQASGRFDEAFATLRDARKLLRTPSVTAAFGREVDERITAFTRERIEALSARYGRRSFRRTAPQAMRANSRHSPMWRPGWPAEGPCARSTPRSMLLVRRRSRLSPNSISSRWTMW
jgi:tetratricopeptide (TPR) repeat protein